MKSTHCLWTHLSAAPVSSHRHETVFPHSAELVCCHEDSNTADSTGSTASIYLAFNSRPSFRHQPAYRPPPIYGCNPLIAVDAVWIEMVHSTLGPVVPVRSEEWSTQKRLFSVSSGGEFRNFERSHLSSINNGTILREPDDALGRYNDSPRWTSDFGVPLNDRRFGVLLPAPTQIVRVVKA